MCDSCLNHQIRLYRPHQFLHCQYVDGVLDNRTTEPRKIIDILLAHTLLQPVAGLRLKRMVLSELFYARRAFGFKLLNRIHGISQ